MEKGYVYLYVNKINGKWYIGSHKGTDKYYRTGGVLLKKALSKYGKDNFVRTILFYSSDYRSIEESLLVGLDAATDENSYNLTNSAQGKSSNPQLALHNKSRVKACIIDGVEYASQKEAAQKLGLSKSYVNELIKKYNGKRPKNTRNFK